MQIDDIINSDDKRIKSLDYILKACNSQTSGFNTFTEPDYEKFKYLETSIEMLNIIGYVNIYSSSRNEIEVRSTIDGKLFIQNDSFEDQKEKKKQKLKIEEEMLEHSRIQYKVNKNAIRAAKREPWLIAWSIISTLAAILIGILK